MEGSAQASDSKIARMVSNEGDVRLLSTVNGVVQGMPMLMKSGSTGLVALLLYITMCCYAGTFLMQISENQTNVCFMLCTFHIGEFLNLLSFFSPGKL